jgi:CRP/FNR family cyclic AMP-dependent transcriptional regulator
MKVDISSFNWHQVPLFADMPESEVRRFVSTGFCFQYEAGGLLVSNSDPGETFFIVLRGLAKLSLINAQSQPVNAALFVPGDFFGEMAMLDPTSTRSGDILAITELEVMTMHKKEFLKMAQESGMLSFNLARNLAGRLRTMNQRIMTEALTNPVHKVAHTLMSLSSKGKRQPEQAQILMPPLSLQDWALFCYTNPDQFRSSIDILQRKGAVDLVNHQLVITDLSKLAQIAQADAEHVKT